MEGFPPAGHYLGETRLERRFPMKTNGNLGPLIRRLQGLAATRPGAEEWTDGELLHAFIADKDDKAFASIVRRYGALVLGVCRRVLRHEQDAEDACQATFLLLARRALAVRRQASLASWLHGVAARTAANARRSAARRQKHEGRIDSPRPADPGWLAGWREVQALLDEEIGRLPTRYREPFVLCCLESLSCDDAARRLGQKAGTVWSRLARARERLRVRLAARGVSLSAVLAAVAVAGDNAAASMPCHLLSSTVHAAAIAADKSLSTTLVSTAFEAIRDGMNGALVMSKTKSVVIVAFIGGLLTCGTAARVDWATGVPGMAAAQDLPKVPMSPPSTATNGKTEPPAGKARDSQLAALEKKLLGNWKGGACEGDYTFSPDGTFGLRHFTPGGNTVTGTWAIRWDALPPALVLTCKTSDFKKKDPTRAEYEYLGKALELKLLELNGDAFVFRYPYYEGDMRYKRPDEK
jgi:RNA polymerase sigma factor (sigma-70 family)